jgi:hypothetical protein
MNTDFITTVSNQLSYFVNGHLLVSSLTEGRLGPQD